MDQFIELQEQDFSPPLALTPAEAEELRQLKMEIIPEWSSVPAEAGEKQAGEAGPLYKVKPGCLVGHFRLTSPTRRVVRITPKVGIRNVFSLLGAAYRFYSGPGKSPFRRESVSYDVDKTQVLEPLVRHFNDSVKRLLQDGLLTNYIEQEQNLQVLRGRLAFSKHLAQNLVRKERLYCRFFQAEVDIPENQVILWTLILLNRAGEWCQEVHQTLHSHILHFGGVSVRQFLPRQFPIFHYNRLSTRYREVHDWCKLFIDLLSISDKPGETVFNGYLLNMNELFERFVVCLFMRAGESMPLVRVTYHDDQSLDLDSRVRIEPDLTLRGPNQAVIAVDAKYKRTDGTGKAKHPDLYQVISYCTALGLIGQESTPVHGILVYPVAERTHELEDLLNIITSKKRSSELSVLPMWLDLDCDDPVGKGLHSIENTLYQAFPLLKS